MNIRPMTGEDRAAVLQLIHATRMFTEEEERVAAELIDAYLTEPDQKDYIIDVAAGAAGAAEGYLCYGPTPLTEGTFDLYWIAVHPGRHNQGLGTALVAHMERQIRRQGGRLVIVETSSREAYASTRRFYLGRGYHEASRIKDYYRPGDDCVTYCKYIQTEGI